MKRLMSGLLLALVALFLPASSFAYSAEMEQIAEALNNELSGQDTVRSVKYDGHDLIFNMSPDLVSEEDSALFEAVTDPAALKPIVMAEAMGELDVQTKELFMTVLETYDANLILKIPLKNGRSFDLVLTADDFRDL